MCMVSVVPKANRIRLSALDGTPLIHVIGTEDEAMDKTNRCGVLGFLTLASSFQAWDRFGPDRRLAICDPPRSYSKR